MGRSINMIRTTLKKINRYIENQVLPKRSMFVGHLSLISYIKEIIMNKRSIKIGEHLIKIEVHSVNLMNFFNRNFKTIKNGNLRPDILINIEEGYGVPFVDYGVAIIKESNFISFRRADYLIEVDSEYHNAKISVHNELALKHALMNLYSSFIVNHNWGLLIHSSCVIENGKAHIFAGKSGAGKSTAAKLSYPRDLLSDEATLVKITHDNITVYNSPFRSELETIGTENSSLLASIHVLLQALQNKKVRIRKSDALLTLMDKVFYWIHTPEETRKILQLLEILINTVPVYELHFQKNNKFWELIC